jgi:hypothetical protein
LNDILGGDANPRMNPELLRMASGHSPISRTLQQLKILFAHFDVHLDSAF